MPILSSASGVKKLFSPTQSLQAASEVIFINNRLRKTANAQIIYACVMLGQAVLSYPKPGAIVSMLGAVVLGSEAMWLLRSKRPGLILGAAIVLWAAAVWNVYLYFRSPTENLSVTWVFVALLYCYFGFRELATYRKFRAALSSQTPEAVAELAHILSTLSSTDSAVLEPHVNGDRWQVLLYENGIVMRDLAKGAMLIEDRDNTRVESQGKALASGLQKMRIEVRGRKLSCTFRDYEAESILAWSGGANSFSYHNVDVTAGT